MPRTIIVVPCYNEGQRLDVARFRDYARIASDVQFLMVDDGSSDDTLAVFDKMRNGCSSRFLVHALPQNRGKAEAVRQGMLAALACSPDFVAFWDADLATPLEAIPRFLEVFAERPAMQCVLGSRVSLLGRRIERSGRRQFTGRVFATAAAWVLGLAVYDTQCGAKMFRATPQTADLFREPFASRWIFDVELLARAVQLGAWGGRAAANALFELPLDEWRDVPGSKLRTKDFVRAMFDLVVIRRRYPGLRVRPAGLPPGGTILPAPPTERDIRQEPRKAA